MMKIFKLIIIVFMIIGITVSVLNIMSVRSMAVTTSFKGEPATGTLDENDNCTGRPSNC